MVVVHRHGVVILKGIATIAGSGLMAEIVVRGRVRWVLVVVKRRSVCRVAVVAGVVVVGRACVVVVAGGHLGDFVREGTSDGRTKDSYTTRAMSWS